MMILEIITFLFALFCSFLGIFGWGVAAREDNKDYYIWTLGSIIVASYLWWVFATLITIQ